MLKKIIHRSSEEKKTRYLSCDTTRNIIANGMESK